MENVSPESNSCANSSVHNFESAKQLDRGLKADLADDARSAAASKPSGTRTKRDMVDSGRPGHFQRL